MTVQPKSLCLHPATPEPFTAVPADLSDQALADRLRVLCGELTGILRELGGRGLAVCIATQPESVRNLLLGRGGYSSTLGVGSELSVTSVSRTTTATY
jgi:hypothetical protein